jgi:hypothetical protein
MVNKFTYLSMFATKPKEKFSLQEFQDYFKIPHQTIKKHFEEFVKLRILKKDKRKRFLFYSLNLENPITLDALSICEKLRLQKRLDEEIQFLVGVRLKVAPRLSAGQA